MSTFTRRLLPALVSSLGAGALACADAPPRVLMIVSDTLRADALSCYGGPAHTPNICALAESGVLFENAFSSGSWTLPASVSMFTANHASEYTRFREPAAADAEDVRWLGDRFLYVHDREELLGEALRERGYDVKSFLENEIPRQANQLQGFEHVPVDADVGDVGAEIAQALGIDLSDKRHRRLLPILAYLWSVEEGQPFFLLEWIRDPHAVYRPPEPWLEELAPYAAKLPRPLEFYTKLGSRNRPGQGIVDLRDFARIMSLREAVLLRRLYLAEVESVDQRVGWLLEALDRRGLRDRTLVVFTSDHGEGFGEHGQFLHGHSFWNELIHVPLILAGPGVARGARLSARVSHVDLMPTLAELLGVPRGADDLRGRSLAALVARGRGASARAHYLVNEDARGGDALIDGRFKLVADPDGSALFDLATDGGERRDLSRRRPALTAALERKARRLRLENAERWKENVAGDDAGRIREVGDATLRELRALGYVE